MQDFSDLKGCDLPELTRRLNELNVLRDKIAGEINRKKTSPASLTPTEQAERQKELELRRKIYRCVKNLPKLHLKEQEVNLRFYIEMETEDSLLGALCDKRPGRFTVREMLEPQCSVVVLDGTPSGIIRFINEVSDQLEPDDIWDEVVPREVSDAINAIDEMMRHSDSRYSFKRKEITDGNV